MNNLRSVLSIVLSKIPPRKILREEISYNNITRETFVQIAGYYVKNYSNDELENLFNYIQNEYEEQADFMRGYKHYISDDQNSFNVFDAVLIFAVRTLQEKNGEPVCRYEHMLRWRMTSHELDEDVFTTAYFAYKDVAYLNLNRRFSWKPVIGHNNVYLNKILSQGMADNHFHLKGSAPQFPISWISLMNNVTSARFRENIDRYSKKRLSAIYSTGGEDDDEEALYVSYLKAALIRSYLFSRLTDNSFFLDMKLTKDGSGDKTKNHEASTHLLVEELLRGKDEILFYRDEIQNNISYFKALKAHKYGGYSELDYALSGSYYHGNAKNDVNFILSGERWLMYRMFQLIFSKNEQYKKYYNMFYAYLVIKGTMRSELVQTNSNIGFDNFAKYQDRKEDFVDGTPFEKIYLEMAVKGTLINQNILNLEVRIAPKETAEKDRDYIRRVENIFKKNPELKEKYFYVFHFIKEGDDRRASASDILCRHHRKRRKLRMQAQAIVKMREIYPHEASRLRGIDACSKEIGCRPEVLAQAYRFLSNHIVYENRNERIPKVPQLSMTYHIGEDYLDIIDGLRAIDEAVLFLQLNCGSRIGHALALGVDVEEYYKIKNNSMLMSKQDYLDNLVWLYYRIKRFGLKNYDDLLLFIEQEYSKYFRMIYGNYICDSFFYAMIKDAREYFRENGEAIVEGYCNSHFYFRISEYYASWKLRGDDPECYINGYFKEKSGDEQKWDHYAVNRDDAIDHKIRFNPEAAYLYYLYHYSAKAKEEGSKVIEIKASHQMIMCVKEIQYEMQKWIAKLGIGIEANPSSNFLISPFKRYDKHPIVHFYNLGLTTKQEELERCPQLSVCVNTDDQGIFSTYLENEYALLALALEKAKDENGKNKYNRTMIYQWIDNIRQLGLNLSFSENKTLIPEEDESVDWERQSL